MNNENLSFWKRMAKFNVIRSRMQGYIAIINFAMIAKVFLETFSNKILGLFLLASGGIALFIWTLIDYKYVMGEEQAILFQKNKEWQDFKEANK